MVTTRSKNIRHDNINITTPEKRIQTMPTTPQTDTTVPMSAVLGSLEARALHYFMGGMDLDKQGQATRPKKDWNIVWTKLDSYVGYTGDEERYELSFKKSAKRGECGLNHAGTHILFPLFLRGSCNDGGMRDEDVIEVAEIMPPTIMDKKFFMKLSHFVRATCKDEIAGTVEYPKWLCDWDYYSFQRNVLEPNREHIKLIMGLSDTITERVVTCAQYIIDDWTGEADPDSRDEYLLNHRNFFTVEGLEF